MTVGHFVECHKRGGFKVNAYKRTVILVGEEERFLSEGTCQWGTVRLCIRYFG